MFAQVSLLIILITAITSMWVTVGERETDPFDARLSWRTLWILLINKKILKDEEEKKRLE